MSIFKDDKDDKLDEEKKSDLFTVVNEDDQDDFDMELVSKVLEDDSVVKSTNEEVPEKKEEKEENQNIIPAEHSAILENADPDLDAITVITKGTTINGSIISDCSLDVMGTINGDIECLGKLTISGKVTGNSIAAEVYVNTSRLEGNITSEGSVKVGNNTVVIGDISASSAVIAGAVKGEIDIKGPVVLDSTSVVKGNIKAKAVQMNNGALLEGFCSLTYADVEIDSMFD